MTRHFIASLALVAGSAMILGSAGAEGGRSRRSLSTPTNLEMLEGLARDVVDSLVEKAPVRRGDVIYIRPSATHSAGWLIENYLAARLAAGGAAVYLEATRPDSARGATVSPSDTSSAAATDSAAVGAGASALEQGAAALGRDASGSVVGSPARGPDAGLSKASVKGHGDGKVLEYRIGELEVSYPRRWRSSLFGSAMVERSARVAVFLRLVDAEDGRMLWADSARASASDVVPAKLLAELEQAEGQKKLAGTGTDGLGRIVEPIVVTGIVVGLVFLFYSSRT